MEAKNVRKNMISSILLQAVTMICSFIIPQVTLRCFGSAVNGLCNSITQFLNVIALLEGGATSVVLANLYAPVRQNNIEKINRIVAASNIFFRQLATIFVIYAAIVGFIYPLIKEMPFDYEYVVALVWVIGFSTFIQYAYAFTYRILLRAGQRVYIVSYIQIIFNILNTIVMVILATTSRNVLFARVGSAIVFLIQPLLLSHFANKYFPIDKKAKPDETALSQRWDSFGQNIAYFIHSNTDIVLLTIFSSFLEISVYTVHSGIIAAVRGIILSVSTAFGPTMGYILAGKNEEETKQTFSVYTFLVWFIAIIMFSTTIITIEPFISVYTMGIEDVNYRRFLFAAFLICAEAIYCIRDPYISVIYSKGHFKQTKWSAYGEAIINIVLSMVLIKRFGIEGVAMGTLIGMVVRGIYSAHYVHNNLISDTIKQFYSFFFSLVAFFGLSITVGYHIQSITIGGYLRWVRMAGCVFVVNTVCISAISYLLYRKALIQMLKLIFKRSNSV